MEATCGRERVSLLPSGKGNNDDKVNVDALRQCHVSMTTKVGDTSSIDLFNCRLYRFFHFVYATANFNAESSALHIPTLLARY